MAFKNARKNIILPYSPVKNYVGIEFGENTIKIAVLKNVFNRKEVASLISKNTFGLSDGDISVFLSSSLKNLKVKTADVVDILPTSLVITKNIEIPSIDPKELREIINLQAGRHTPYSREEIIVDYINIGTYKHNYSKILLVIVARSAVKKQFEILNKAGLKLRSVFFAPESTAYFITKLCKINTENAPVAVLHCGAYATDFLVVFRNKPIFVRNIPVGVGHIAEVREKSLGKFLEEIKKSMEAYSLENIEGNLSTVILSGGLEEFKELLETKLREYLNVSVTSISYFNKFQVSGEVLRNYAEFKRESFLNLITCLLAHNELGVNLLPEEIRIKRNVEEKGKELIRSSVLILTAVIFIVIILITKIYFKSAYLKEIQTKYVPLTQKAQKLERDFTEVNLVKKYLINRGYSLEALIKLYDLVPLGMELNNIKCDEQDKFSIRGSAHTMSEVFSLVDSMEKTESFKDVKTKYTAKRKDGARDLVDFEIYCMLRVKMADK